MLRLPDPEPSLQTRAPAPPSTSRPRSNGSARNPLFRAIDGGLSDGDADARPRPGRGSARRTRADVLPARKVQPARAAEPETPSAPARMRPECYGCPVGLAFGTVRDASPEALDHLVAASRELVSAARSVMEALEANLERHSHHGPTQRIELD